MQGEGHKAEWLYTETLKVLPDAGQVWHEFGVLLHGRGKQQEALNSFRTALALPGSHVAKTLESLENTKSFIVDRWHFRMLNDKQRNVAYDTAIRRAVSSFIARCGRPPTVLDIGAGTGLLSVMAARAGAAKVFACEVNDSLCRVAEEAVAGAGLSDVVTVLSAMSTDLRVNGEQQGGLPAPVDIIVTELVDSGLLGEKIIPALRHAQLCLLAGDGLVLPAGCSVYGVLIDSDEVLRRTVLDVGSFSSLNAGSFLRDGCSVDEPYSCEQLERLPHTRLHNPVHLRDIAFVAAPSECGVSRVEVSIETAGRVSAIAIWYDLHVDPDDGGTVSTRPDRGHECGWDQGIYAIEGCEAPLRVRPGDIVAVNCWHEDDRLRFCLAPNQHPETPSDATKPAPLPTAPAYSVGEMDMAMLNDRHRHEKIFAALRDSSIFECDTVCCLARNWCPIPAYLGSFVGSRQRLVVHVDDSCAAAAVRQACEDALGDGGACVVSRWEDAVSACRGVPPTTAEGTTVALVVTDAVEGCGLLRQHVALNCALLSCTGCEPAVVIPTALSLRACLIDCPSLHRENTVDPAATVGVDVSGLNAYGVSCFRELRLDAPHTGFLSAAFDAAEFSLLGLARAGQVATQQTVPVNRSGAITAVGFWFRQRLTADVVISTGPKSDGGHEGSHWRQAAFLLEHPCVVEAGDQVDVSCVVYSNSRVVFAVEPA